MIENTKRAEKFKFKFSMISIILLCLYILFSYIAQETLLPTRIHSLVMYAFVAWVLLSVLRSKRYEIPSFTVWMGVMLAISIISLLWTSKNTISTEAVYTMLVATVITYCITQTVNTFSRLEKCLIAFVIGAVLMGLMLLVTGQITGDERLGETVTGNANTFSALMMIAAASALWLMLNREKGWEKFLFFLATVAIFALMLFSGGRKTIVAVLVALVFYILFKGKSGVKHVVGKLFIIVAIVAGIYALLMEVPFFYELIGNRFEGMFDFFSGNSQISGDETRYKMIEIGLNKWLESPVFGYGVDSFKYYNVTVTGHFYYAHNNYVELLYDLGIIGFLAYYGFVVKTLKDLFKIKGEYKKYASLGIGLIFMILVYDMGGISFYSTFPLMILSFAYIVIKLANKKEEKQ